jgi:peptidoglycan/LPS O-acetylase OafA/YrhL
VNTHDDYLSSRYFKCLDGLRAFAVVWVVVYHCSSDVNTGIVWLDRLIAGGDFGVDVFFVISGFLITTLILREKPAPLGLRLRRFYIRRSLRIFPVYYAAILIFWGAAYLVGDQGSVRRYVEFVPSLFAYFSDYAIAFDPDPFPVFGHSWSLAVEEKYYLLWPLVVMTLRSRAAALAAIALIGGSILLRWSILSGAGEGAVSRVYYAFDTRFDEILWGALLAFVLHSRRGFGIALACSGAPAIGVAATSLAVYACFATNGDAARYVVAPLLSAVILASYVTRPDSPGSTFLEWRPIVFIGRVSYGVYIFHTLAISVAKRACDALGGEFAVTWFLIPLSLAISVGVAAASFRWFETPFLKIKDRFR